MTSIAELSCDDSLICDDFDDFESKDLNQMNKTILHYEIMLNKFKNIRDYIHLSYQFPIAKEREVIKNSLDYNNEKGIKFRFTVKKYIVTIKEHLDNAKIIYNEKKLQRKEEVLKTENVRKNIKKVCECGCEVASRNLAEHKRSKKHLKYLDSLNTNI
jgi:hypothetical protein